MNNFWKFWTFFKANFGAANLYTKLLIVALALGVIVAIVIVLSIVDFSFDPTKVVQP